MQKSKTKGPFEEGAAATSSEVNSTSAVKSIFLACPIGDTGSDTRKRSDSIQRHLIAPALKEFKDGKKIQFNLTRADKDTDSPRITTNILKQLNTADIVVADLTGLNSNVLYEIGIRHALKKPCILIAQHGTILPFDLYEHRTIFFNTKEEPFEELLDSVQQTITELVKHLESALDPNYRDPLYEMIFSDNTSSVMQDDNQLKDFKNSHDLMFETLQTVATLAPAITPLGPKISSIKSSIDEIARSLHYKPTHSDGSYVYIEGQEEAFHELEAAIARAKSHVRSTRFSKSPISGRRDSYNDAIEKSVRGGEKYPFIRHSRIIATNDSRKMEDIQRYIKNLTGKPFSLYLTQDPNNFELVTIDEAEVFIHFHGTDGNIIDSTVHFFGTDVTKRFIALFDEFHDPAFHSKVKKYDCRYIGEHEVDIKLKEIRQLFE